MTYRHRANLVVLLLGVCFLSLTAAFIALHITGPSDGARLEPGGLVWNYAGVTVSPVERHRVGGLQAGDIVVAVAGRSIEEWTHLLVDPEVTRPHWRVGDIVAFTVLRAGHQVDVPVTIGPYPIGAILRDGLGSLVFALTFALIGAFVFLRRPADSAARALFLAGCCLLSAQTWSLGLQVYDLVNATGFWLYQITAIGAYTVFWASLLHFALVFPHPHPLTLRWRWLIPATYAGPAVIGVVYLITTRATTHTTLDWIGTWAPGQGVIGIIYFAAALLILLDTYRISRDPVTSRQIRWVVFAGVLSGGAALILSILPGDVFGRAIISTNVLGLVLVPIPFALAFAILRYRLFDIDIIIHRTLVYGSLTAVLAGVYFLGVVGVQAIINTLAGRALAGRQEPQSPVLIVVTTLIIAALFQPLRRRIQAFIDRRFYRSKYDTKTMLDRFGASLRSEVELTHLTNRLLETVEQTMHPEHVSLWLREQAPPTTDHGQ
jgi:hypothetical protein